MIRIKKLLDDNLFFMPHNLKKFFITAKIYRSADIKKSLCNALKEYNKTTPQKISRLDLKQYAAQIIFFEILTTLAHANQQYLTEHQLAKILAYSMQHNLLLTYDKINKRFTT